jgi:putative ABC transport system substrate-binding protein
VRRRELIALLGGAAALWPPAARAQQSERLRRVGALFPFPESDPTTQSFVAALAQALARLGWVEGKNVRIDYRFAANDPARIRSYATELVRLSPDAILAVTPPAVLALQQQTHTIAIVFLFVLDPVGQGLVQSLARPGGNMTGFGAVDSPIIAKWLQLLKEIAPGVTRVAVIVNPDTQPYTAFFNNVLEAAGAALGVTVTPAPVHDDATIEEASAAEARQPGGGVITLPDSFNLAHRDAIIAAASRHGLPLFGFGDQFTRSGALMSYWFDPLDLFAPAASYVDRILKGANPADLPVQYPTKYSLVINLKTAKALGLTVPQSLLQRADEVIE